MKELNIGDKIYYTTEDRRTGKDIINEGYIVAFDDNQKLFVGDRYLKLSRFYNISNEVDGEVEASLQRNLIYTIEDLFEIKNKYEENLRNLEK